MHMEKYWKTTLNVEVLTEGDEKPSEPVDLADVAYQISDGDASGHITSKVEEVTETEMRQLLINQGSDPDFLIHEEEDDAE
jgi:hypothetical protein